MFAIIVHDTPPNERLSTLELVRTRVAAVVRDYDVVAIPEDLAMPPALLVLCEDMARTEHAAAIAARLHEAIRGGDPEDGGPPWFATIGASFHEGGMVDGAALVRRAVEAAQRAHQAGDDFEFSDLQHARSAAAAGELTDRLRRAIDAGDLVLHYQPKVELGSHRLMGLEALVRWPDPDGRLIPPAQFIPLAERSGLIGRLGAWVIEEACRQLAEWHHDLGLPEGILMCTNVSGKQFTPHLAESIASAIDSAGVGGDSMVLEVTETVVMADVEGAIDTLRALKGVGVHVAVDDFGTGYSSLAYLKRLPLDELKIDRAFVDGLGQDPEDTAIAGAVVALGHALDLMVIAEGVETEVQLRALESLGCDSAQGFYFSRPLSPVAVRDLLRPPYVLMGSGVGSSASARAEVVLVADDASDVRQLACVSLSTAGFETHEASGGDEALALSARLRPDCVLLDLSMPGLDGFETCRALRAAPATARCAIVILTSRASADDKIAAFSAGADDYLVKPFAPRDLVGRVRDALRRRQDTISAEPLS